MPEEQNKPQVRVFMKWKETGKRGSAIEFMSGYSPMELMDILKHFIKMHNEHVPNAPIIIEKK